MSPKQELANEIADFVNSSQGCDNTELTCGVYKKIYTRDHLRDLFASGCLFELIDLSISQGRFIEIKYTLPQTPKMILSWYLPRGTKIIQTER